MSELHSKLTLDVLQPLLDGILDEWEVLLDGVDAIFTKTRGILRNSVYFRLFPIFNPSIPDIMLVLRISVYSGNYSRIIAAPLGETAEDAFNRLLPTNDNGSAYHSRLQKILALQGTVKKIDEAREADVEDEKPEYEEDNDPQVEGEAKAAMQDVVDMHDNAADTITLEERVDMLNADQTRL